MSKTQGDALTYCRDLVRNSDPDRYLLSLFAPWKGRPAVWALMAFYLEIAKTRDLVTETTLGLIRLQWWRDEINRIYQGATVDTHPVLAALTVVIRDHALPQDDFDMMIYAREFDLEDVVPETIEGLVKYATYTNAPLMRQMMRVLKGNPDHADVERIAASFALTAIIRNIPHLAARGRNLLPPHTDRAAMIADIFTHADLSAIKPRHKFLRAAKTLAVINADQIRKAHFNPDDPRLAIPPPFREFRVFLKTYAAA